MKLTKEDYMRLPKERLAELLADIDNTPVEPIVIPQSPSIVPNTTPFGPPYIITDNGDSISAKDSVDVRTYGKLTKGK